jgi:aquaporin rerated protein, other eukaryote
MSAFPRSVPEMTIAQDPYEESSVDPTNDLYGRPRSFDRLQQQGHAQHHQGNTISPQQSYPAGFQTTTTARKPSISIQATQPPPLKTRISTKSFQNVGSGSVMSSAPSGEKEKQDHTTEVIQSKLPHFMRSIPTNIHEKIPPQLRFGKGGNDIENGTNGGNQPPSHWTSKDYYDFYSRKVLNRRLAMKNLIIATLAEFVGTCMFLFFALAINSTCSTVKDMEKEAGLRTNDLTALLVSSVGFAFSLAISAWVFFRVSGGVQNPAITVALALSGAFGWQRAIALTVAQYLGAIAASGLIVGLYPSHTLNTRTTLNPQMTINQGFWLEFLMSALLIFTVLMLAAEKHRGTFLAPIGIGLCLLITQLLGQPYTGASVNPARTLGPDIVQGQFDHYTWIYYAGPYAAAIATAAFYAMLKWMKYETAAPDQDADEAGAGQTCQVLVDASGNHVGRLDTFNVEEYQAIIDAKEKQEQEEIIAQHREREAANSQQLSNQNSHDAEKEYLQSSYTGTTTYGSAMQPFPPTADLTASPQRMPSMEVGRSNSLAHQPSITVPPRSHAF